MGERLIADSRVVACRVITHRLKPDGGVVVADECYFLGIRRQCPYCAARGIEQHRIKTERGVMITGGVGLERVKTNGGIKLAGGDCAKRELVPKAVLKPG